MPGVTFTPPLWVDVLGAAAWLGFWVRFLGKKVAHQEAEDDERRSRHVPDDEIDTDYASGGE